MRLLARDTIRYSHTKPNAMEPEDKARQRIDHLFAQAGWLVQDYGAHNIAAGSRFASSRLPPGSPCIASRRK